MGKDKIKYEMHAMRLADFNSIWIHEVDDGENKIFCDIRVMGNSKEEFKRKKEIGRIITNFLNQNDSNTLKCLALKKTIDEKGKKVDVYMVANGMNQGRWTAHFGVHCLADTLDTRGYLLLKHEEVEEATTIETYNINAHEE